LFDLDWGIRWSNHRGEGFRATIGAASSSSSSTRRRSCHGRSHYHKDERKTQNTDKYDPTGFRTCNSTYFFESFDLDSFDNNLLLSFGLELIGNFLGQLRGNFRSQKLRHIVRRRGQFGDYRSRNRIVGTRDEDILLFVVLIQGSVLAHQTTDSLRP
jgi:hypothetical protein